MFLLDDNSKKPNVLYVTVKHNNKPVSGLYDVDIKRNSKSEFEKLKTLGYIN